MSTSTDGYIFYGAIFEEGYEFPWDIEYDGDMDEWWLNKLSYKPPFEIYTTEGGYLGGKRPPEDQISEYYLHRMDFLTNNPCPVAIVNYCSSDVPMHGLAVPKTVKVARRGYPTTLDPLSFEVSEEELSQFTKFCLENGIELPHEPAWWLSSYWG